MRARHLAITASLALIVGGCSLRPNKVMEANEVQTIAMLRSIAFAQIAYSATCGSGGYARTIKDLKTPPAGERSVLELPDSAKERADGSLEAYGYVIRIAAGLAAQPGPADCNKALTSSGYYASAEPVTPGTTGSRSFATSADGTVSEVAGARAPSEPFGAPAKPVQ